jgi:2-deoxy-D-gluconate 3-dehydrogenase
MHESLQSLFDLTGKVSIVTGASRGLGVAMARGLAKAGSDLAIAARDGERLEAVAQDLRSYGRRVLPVPTDITREDSVEAMVERVAAEFGHLDVLVNNAGISALAGAEEMTAEQWQGVIDVNLTGVFYCAQKAGRRMLEQGHGKIINVASMIGFVGANSTAQASYVASKTAVIGLTKALTLEWAPRGLHVTALAPGPFPSDQTRWAYEQDQELARKLLQKFPMGRMGRLEELEGSIVYLASAASDYMNGQALIIDGGYLSA